MSDDLSKVDWGKPIEAYHDDGWVMEAQFGSHESGGTASVKFMGRWWNALKPSGYVGNGWRIRNVAEVPRNSEEPSDSIAKRMEALVRAIADVPRDSVLGQSSYASEARAIVALLAEPVDADLVEAREIAAGLYDILDSGEDDKTMIALAAIRRGRALERDSREG